MRRRLRQEWRALLLAIGLLTRVPIPAIGSCDSRTVGLSLHWYPVAGLLIALPLVAVAALTQSSPPLAAALVLGLGAVAIWGIRTPPAAPSR